VGRPRGESRGVSRERARYGCTQIVRVAEVGRMHRASCPLGGCKASWRARALAGRKPEASPDARHGWRKGETVRGKARTVHVRAAPACGFRLAGSRYDGRCSRAFARIALTGGTKQGPSTRRSIVGQVLHFGGDHDGKRIGRRRSAGRACLRVTTRTPDGRRGSVKAPRGPRRIEGSPHPRR
jgi:hypothetical protein